MDNEKYIYYIDVLKCLDIILGKEKLTKLRRKLYEEEYDRLQKLYEEDIKNYKKGHKIKGIYKADITALENGMIYIAYECDKENNTECNKRNCDKDYCTHTIDKKYAKNYYNE